MIKHDWKPGTVAVATVRGVPNVRVLRGNREEYWSHANDVDDRRLRGAALTADDGVTDIRPLVVLDPVEITGPDETGDAPAAPEIAKCLRRLADEDHPSSYRRKVAERIADQIAAQTHPPKPAEPTGLGAVVEDSEGRQWIRYSPHDGCSWMRQTSRAPAYVDYESFHAVRILSEGVEVDR